MRKKLLIAVFLLSIIGQGAYSQKIDNADTCFEISRKFADRLKIDSALFYANKIKDLKNGLGKYHLAISIAQYYRNQNDESKINANEAIRIFGEQKNKKFQGMAYHQYGTIEEKARNADSSRKYYYEAIRLLKSVADEKELFKTYFWLARSYAKTSEHDSSTNYYVQALKLAEGLKDSTRIYITATELAEEFLILSDLQKANQYFEYGFNYRVSTTDKVGYWRHVAKYTSCLIRLHEFKRADSAFLEFERMTKQFDHVWGWIELDKLKGIRQYQSENYSEAFIYLDKAYRKENQAPINDVELLDIVMHLAKTEFKLNKYDSAIVHLRLGSELAHSLKDLLGALDADYLLSQSFEKLNKDDSALAYFKKYAGLKESVLSLEKQRMIAEVTTRFETEKKEREISSLQKEGAAQAEQKRLAFIAIGVIVLIGAYAFYRSRQHRQLSKRLAASLSELKRTQQQLVEAEKEKEAENVRLGISHDIHDEVGATLSGVALFSEIAKEKMQQQQTKDVEEYLEHISANSKEMVNKISDIVWAINPENDSYERIVEKLRAFAVNLCAGKGIVLHIDLDERLKDHHPPMHVKRNFYLFIKEGINNAIKYSNGKNIFLSVALESDSIVAVVRDDGNGFDTNKIYPGNGLNSMKARAENLNAKFDMDSHPGTGTAIRLRFEFHPIGGQRETV